MSKQLARHGSEAGYRAELQTGNVCERCRNGHRVFDRQYSKASKAKGIKYDRFQVLDHLYQPGRARPAPAPGQSRPERTGQSKARYRPEPQARPAASPEDSSTSADASDSGSVKEPSTGQRLADAIRGAFIPDRDDSFVATDDIPDYLYPIDPDPEPGGDWSEAGQPDEFVINQAGMQLIEENLGTYMSVIGITLEMIDPYCGPVLADNFDNIINRWTKVIAHYPRAAKLFMSKDGGTLMTWIGALQATWPVLYAVYEHHLARTVQTDKDGRVFRVRNTANGHVDATMPPVPDYDYTVN